MQVPPFLTNKQDVVTTLAAGLCIGSVCTFPKTGAIAAVAGRALHYYCGWGSTIGAFLAYGGIEKANQDKSQNEKSSPLLGAVVFGVIGYGIERIARRVFFS